ncbi:MAG: flagellar basal body rod protein FlgC [Eubacteriales bacterium]
MSFLRSLNIPGSSLTAQKFRMEIAAQNMANAASNAGSRVYAKKTAVLGERRDYGAFKREYSNAVNEINSYGGVEVKSVTEDASFKVEYDPQNPLADENGYVKIPNIDTTEEMIEMMLASRAYEANVTAFNAVKQMAEKALEIGK